MSGSGAIGLMFGLSIGFAIACTPPSDSAAPSAAAQRTFESPEMAGEALIAAAERFEKATLEEILGPDSVDLVITEDPVQDKNQSMAFAAQAREKHRIEVDPENSKVASLIVGVEDWPLPIPIIQDGGRWRFDTKAGREEILHRRIGQNELTAIEVCRGYVEAQHEYALEKHDGSPVNQYAQRVISTPGKHDGLGWKEKDGTWGGPVGEGIARAIAEGYTHRLPYHGYYFKILKGQGPAAPFGEMDFLVKDVMIGGFAFVAAPADYAVTGVQTFIVSHDGVVYEKDLGPDTLEAFNAMTRFDPDPTWNPVQAP